MQQEIRAILDYFEEHEDVFTTAVEELDDKFTWLGDARYCPMRKRDRRRELGHDEDEFEVVDGQKRFAKFNMKRRWCYLGAKGRLISSDHKDYSEWMTELTVYAMLMNRNKIPTVCKNAELNALFDAAIKEPR